MKSPLYKQDGKVFNLNEIAFISRLIGSSYKNKHGNGHYDVVLKSGKVIDMYGTPNERQYLIEAWENEIAS